LTREFTERMFDLPHFILAVLSEDGKRYEVRVASGCDESSFRAFEVDLEGENLVALLGREKNLMYVPSLREKEAYQPLRNLTVSSFLLLPFLVQDRVIGFLCSFSQNEDFLDEEKLSNLQVFGNQISIGLQKSLLYEKVQKLSITDGLTKLYSHRHFRERLQEELVLAGRYSSPLSLLMMDIDHFKQYNDNYGHVAGDHVLMQVAKTLREHSEASHLAARYGGEEMVLVAPETTKEQGAELAERIRSAVEGSQISVGKEVTLVKVSIGVATFPQDAQTGVDLIAKADQALYAAKARGRNQVVVYPP
jgi:diguanylate cyclase (GGDEF)-like protein